MNILYVTSFAKDMYEATGKRLVDTYLETKQAGDLLICYENFEFPGYDSDNILSYPLHENDYLNEWLIKNKERIPTEFGGEATRKNAPKVFNEINNYKSSRWFRKVASLNYALQTYGQDEKYDWIIWVDSDCYFLKRIEPEIYHNFPGSYFYYMGRRITKGRKIYGVETGFVGFNKINGYPILQKWIDAYDQKFIKYVRWDDGWVFREILQELKWKGGHDLGKPATKNHVMDDPKTFLYNYFRHSKGIHKTKNIMLKSIKNKK